MNKRYLLGLLLSAFGGYLALSYEIIWTRTFSVAVGNRGATFPMLLGVFLAGIAYGAKLSKKLTEKSETYDQTGLKYIGRCLAASSAVGFLAAPAMAWYLRVAHMMPHFTALYVVFGASVVLGVLFPLVSHFGIPADQRSGARLSYFYGANIVGSVAGSLLTGFLFFDLMTLEMLTVVLTVIGFLISAIVLWVAEPDARAKNIGAVVVGGGLLLASTPILFSSFWENLVYQDEAPQHEFVKVIQSKSGVVLMNEKDEVFSGSVYDGRFNVDLQNDNNGIVRAYSISAFHPAPKKVLMIGLATGSWTRAILNSDDVEKVVVVEIAHDYINLIKSEPDWAPMLDHPKLELIIDDGRRWMHTNDEKFDVVVSNTTFYWRSMATGLLSVEFFKMINEHMTDEGVFMFNTTGSERAYAALFEAFPHGARYMRLGVGSRSPIKPDPERFKDALSRWKIDGKPLLDLTTEEGRHALEQAVLSVTEQFEPESYLRQRMKDEGHEPYTDDNMGDEFEGLL